jgi:hypothetical protein
MGWKDLFSGKQTEEPDPLKDLVLSKLKTGYMLDFDLKTWQVTNYFTYDFGDGYKTQEWELTSGREKWYLERAEDDEVEWTLCKKIPIGSIENSVHKQIIETDDPPDQISCDGQTYYLDESGAGHMYEKGHPPAKEFIYWDFIDKKDENYITIEQWDETEFEAVSGYYVEEYQFTNILPGGGSEK